MPPTGPKHGARIEPLRDFSRSLPMALLRARESVMARFRPMLRAHGLTEQQWRVLRALHSAQAPRRAREVAQMTLLSMPSLSRLLKTLEDRGAIKRVAHREDLRASQISITREGKMLVAKLSPSSETHYAQIEDALGEKDLERLYTLLEVCVARLGAPRPEED